MTSVYYIGLQLRMQIKVHAELLQVAVAETFWNKLKTARAPELHTEAGAAVPITILGTLHMMPVSEISKMTLPQYSRLCLVRFCMPWFCDMKTCLLAVTLVTS